MEHSARGIWRWGTQLVAALVCSMVIAGAALAETDVTAKVQLVKGVLGYDRLNKQSYLDVSVKNTSTDVLLTPIKIVFTGVTPTTVTVANADGKTTDGKSYFTLTTASGQILPGITTAAKKLSFANPASAKFTYVTKVFAQEMDNDGDGFSVSQGDCNDNNRSVFPGALEVCDGVDNNCDGVVDEGVTTTFYRDADGDVVVLT